MPKLLIATTVPATFPFLLPYGDHFRRAGWRVEALTGTREGFAWDDRFDAVHVASWTRDPLAFRRQVRAIGEVRRLVARGGYDLVHVHTPIAAFVTRLALRRRDRAVGPRVVYTVHGFHFHRGGKAWTNAAYLALERLAGRWTDWLVVINDEDEAAARRWHFLPEDRIRRMPGIGLDLRRFSPDAVEDGAVGRLRAELGLGRDPVVLMVAEYSPGKRHVDLLRAFAALCRDPGGPRARLLLAGRGRMEDAVARETRALGIGARVHALGHREDVPVLMRAAQVLVLPSDREGLPRCVMEAMAMGLPVVGTRVRGTADLLAGGCGTLVDVGDVEGLAAAIRHVLAEPLAAAEAAGRAREKVRAYDERVVIRLHEELYAEALAERRAAATVRRAAASSPAP